MKILGLLLLVVSAVGCVSTGSQKSAPAYLDAAQEKFNKAEKAFSDKSYEDAIKYFEDVRSKFPYSKYAALSDLRLGDLFFEQSKWFEAADSYDFFLRFHPGHDKTPYAWFQIAKSYFSAIPKDFFLFPKAYVRDQTATEQAITTVDRFLAEFPDNDKIPEAKEMRVKLRSQIAARDLHVAKYYIKRNHLNGAKLRLEYLLKNYSDTPQAKEALAQLEKLNKTKS